MNGTICVFLFSKLSKLLNATCMHFKVQIVTSSGCIMTVQLRETHPRSMICLSLQRLCPGGVLLISM